MIAIPDDMAVTDSNKNMVVESLRSIAEIVIWGDQNDPKVSESFHFLDANKTMVITARATLIGVAQFAYLFGY